MSIQSPITRAAGWHYGETKDLPITVTSDAGSPVDLTLLDVRWVLKAKRHSQDVLLTKTTEEESISLDDDGSIATIHIDPEDYLLLSPGIYYFELWDATNVLQLAHGTAYLGHGAPPEGS